MGPTLKSHTPQSVVVIGAGVCGLAAAMRLTERGVGRVTVLEGAERPGGLAISLEYEGLSTDLGPHRIYTEIPEVEGIYNEIAGESLIPVKRSSRICIGGRFFQYPLGAAEMIRGAGLARIPRFAASYLWTQALASIGRVDTRTYEGYMRRAFGTALYRWLLEPYSRKVWKTDPKDLDGEAARVRVSAGSLAKMALRLIRSDEGRGQPTALKEFRYVKGGAENLVKHLAARARSLGVEIHMRSRVERLEFENGRAAAALCRTPEGTASFPAERFISTIPLPILAEWAGSAGLLDDAATGAARSLRYLDMIFVSVIVRRPIVTGDNWIYFPDADLVFNRVYESKTFDPGMGPEDRSVLCVEITCRPDQDAWVERDEALAGRVVNQLSGTGLFRRDEVAAAHVHRLRHAYPVYDLGYAGRIAEILRGLAPISNLVTAGRQGLFNFNNMDHSIYMGLRAAECVAAAESPGQAWIGEQEAFHRFRIVD